MLMSHLWVVGSILLLYERDEQESSLKVEM